MDVATQIPSINEFVFGETREPDRFQIDLATFLKRRTYGSLAPVLMTTTEELRAMPLVGPVRFTYIEERLDMLGLDMRDPDQSVVSRAKQLFGSIKDIPIQVLALCIVVHANRPGATIAGYRYSRAIGEIVKLQSVAKVGTFLPDHPRSKARKTTREKLCSFLIEKAAPKALLEERMFNLLAEDLEEVLEFWRKQR